MKKGFFKEKLFYVSAIFFFVLSVVVVSIQNIYAIEELQQTNEEVYEVIDDVTNLEWVENSSATLSWDEVVDANYYSVVVTVYENDGLTLVGSTTTGTTYNQLDVQQEIHDVVGESEYDYVKVKATVTSQFKQDDVVIKQGFGVESGLLTYQIKNMMRIPTPINVVFYDDFSVSFECELDNLEDIIKQVWYGVGVKNKYYCRSTGTGDFEIENHEIRFQISEEFILDMLRSYKLTEGQEIGVKVYLISKNDSYVDSEESAFSNYIYYEASFSQIPTPINVVFYDDFSVSFECELDNLEDIIKQVWYGVGVKNKYYCRSTGTGDFEIENHEIRFQISEEFILDMLRSYKLTEGQEIGVKVYLISKNDSYVDSEESAFSNYIYYDLFIPVESITISPATPYISKGNSYYLGKTIIPLDAHYDEIEWTSDDETIVTVDETGKITGISAGTATVTATIGDVSTSVLVTVYEINTNVDTDQSDDLIGEAGNVIDEIINNDDPNYSNTDIDDEDIDDVTEEIINGIQNDFEFWINCNWNGFGLGHYKDIWDYIIEWYYNQYGENSWNFGWGYEIEYEIGYTDNNNYNHHLANITEFQNEYNITLDLPDDLPAHGNGKKRSYCLVRCHDGQLEIIPVMIDGKGKIHAKSNKYSDFILMYEDVDIVDDNEIYNNETHSASLGDDITVNTYLELQEGVTEPTMTVWLDENNKSTVNGTLQNDGRYKFNYSVACPQIASTIYYTISAIKDGVEVITDIKTYSVREYCEAILNSDKSNEMKNLAAQMLNYGAYSQIYFGYNADDLANKNLESLGYSTALDPSVINENAVGSFDTYDGEIKAQFTTNSLIFESEISLKYYMTLDDDIEEAYMAYRLKDSNSIYTYVKLTKSGNRYYAKIENIKAPLLTDMYESFICVKNGNEYQQISDTKYYSPECYATAIYNNSTKQNMINAVVAMMMYCNAAREYFELD